MKAVCFSCQETLDLRDGVARAMTGHMRLMHPGDYAELDLPETPDLSPVPCPACGASFSPALDGYALRVITLPSGNAMTEPVCTSCG